MDSTLNQTAFERLLDVLKNFQVKESLISEVDLENKLEDYLKTTTLIYQRQRILTKTIRNDIVVRIDGKLFCIELKKFADLSCVQQLDKYLPYYKNGLILMCWKASQSLRDVFKDVKKQIKIPIALIEIRRNQCIV